jgi:hypothetical protein
MNRSTPPFSLADRAGALWPHIRTPRLRDAEENIPIAVWRAHASAAHMREKVEQQIRWYSLSTATEHGKGYEFAAFAG